MSKLQKFFEFNSFEAKYGSLMDCFMHMEDEDNVDSIVMVPFLQEKSPGLGYDKVSDLSKIKLVRGRQPMRRYQVGDNTNGRWRYPFVEFRGKRWEITKNCIKKLTNKFNDELMTIDDRSMEFANNYMLPQSGFINNNDKRGYKAVEITSKFNKLFNLIKKIENEIIIVSIFYKIEDRNPLDETTLFKDPKLKDCLTRSESYKFKMVDISISVQTKPRFSEHENIGIYQSLSIFFIEESKSREMIRRI